MEEAISVIQNEILALNASLQKITALKEAVKSANDASAIKTLVKEAEAVVSKLSNVALAKERFLKTEYKKSMEEYLEAQELSETREVALRLLKQAEELQKKFADEIFVARELLKRSSAFIDFRINVMGGVKADTTYGPPNKSQGDFSARKMFDANV